MTKEEFNKLWKDSTKEEILNQYYYDYKELQRTNNIIKEVRELLKNDYFEDGSFTNYKKVFELLDKGE